MTLHSRLLGFVGGDADFGGSCSLHSGWSSLGCLSFRCGGLQVVGVGTGGGGVLLQSWWLWVSGSGGSDSGGGSAADGGCGIKLLLGLLVGDCCSRLLGLLQLICLGLGFCLWLWAFIFSFYGLIFDGSANSLTQGGCRGLVQ